MTGSIRLLLSTCANYKIVDPAGRPISIASAVYDAAANTVTLRPRTRIDLHNTYHLTVIGKGARGVTNAQGMLWTAQIAANRAAITRRP